MLSVTNHHIYAYTKYTRLEAQKVSLQFFSHSSKKKWKNFSAVLSLYQVFFMNWKDWIKHHFLKKNKIMYFIQPNANQSQSMVIIYRTHEENYTWRSSTESWLSNTC